jgi:transposase InsO family protein
LAALSSRPQAGLSGVTIEAVLSDNGPGYISHAWRDLCADHHIDARRIRAYTDIA